MYIIKFVEEWAMYLDVHLDSVTVTRNSRSRMLVTVDTLCALVDGGRWTVVSGCHSLPEKFV